MSSEKRFLNIIKEKQQETLKDKLGIFRIKETITTNLTMMIINYFEENFKISWKRNRLEYDEFIYKLKKYYPNKITTMGFEYIFYMKVIIHAYRIWMKIEKEYVDNYEVECELLKQH
jgi:hypothetical protein